MKRKTCLWTLLAASSLLAAMCFGCPIVNWLVPEPVPSPPDAVQLRGLERLLEMKLPPSARAVAWRHDSWLDHQVFLKVEIDSAHLQALVQNSPFATMTLSSSEHNLFGELGENWWDGGAKVQRYLFGETLLPLGQQYQDRFIQMLVDISNAHVYVVYLALRST